MTTSEGLQSEDCNSPQKVLPEVTCILNNNLEIVQLVSDAQVRIEVSTRTNKVEIMRLF